MNIFDFKIKWNNKCPKCNKHIHFSLHGTKLGSHGQAWCEEHLRSTRLYDLAELREGKVDFCDWEGEAVRMWDGSVRFRESSGKWLSQQD